MASKDKITPADNLNYTFYQQGVNVSSIVTGCIDEQVSQTIKNILANRMFLRFYYVASYHLLLLNLTERLSYYVDN